MTSQLGTACKSKLLLFSAANISVLSPCRLDSRGDIRVGDFGLAEDIYVTGYFRQKDRADVKLPFKWMAIESLNDAIFTEKTDVVGVSVGML